MAEEPGTLGDYRLLSKLGEGKAGVVYMATPIRPKPFARTGTPVAVKVYKPEILKEPLEADRIENEARLGSEITHPNLVRIYEHYIRRGADSKDIEQAYLVMEYIDGITLSSWLTMFHPFSRRLLIRIFDQVVAGLASLHKVGAIHRDVKPTNIMISSAFEAKVTDFGVVKISAARKDEHTPDDKFLGTIRNASPEQLFGRDFDARTDIFSLGTVLYALIHGYEIFQDEKQFARLIARREHDEPEFSRVSTDDTVGARLVQLAKELMQREAADRPSSAEAVREKLREIQSLLPSDPEHEPVYGYVASALTGLEEEAREAIIFASHVIANACKSRELYVYQPRKASDPLLHRELSASEVYRLDRSRVIAADVLFVLANRPSFGAGQEVEIAASYAKPTILIMRDDVTLSRMTKGSFANVVGEIVYSGPEDLERKLAKLLDNNIDRLRLLRKGAKRSRPIPIGSKLADLRQNSGYPVAEAADKSGISVVMLEAIEEGQYDNVGLVILEKLCNLYSVPIRSLLSGEVAAPRTPRDANLRRLESLATKVGWSAADFIALRDSYESEVAASGSSVTLSDEDWMARHHALERQKMRLTANATDVDEKTGFLDFSYGRKH